MRENLQRMAFDIRSITVKCRARFHLLKSCVPLYVFKVTSGTQLRTRISCWMKAVGWHVLRVGNSSERCSQPFQTGPGGPAMVDFLLHSQGCQLKHGILSRLWDHQIPGSQIQALGAEGRSPAKVSKPGSSWALILEVSWPPLWKRGHQSSADSWRGSGWSPGIYRPSSSSPHTLRPRKVGLQHLEKHLLVWLWSALVAEPAPSAAFPSATSSPSCSSPKTLRRGDTDAHLWNCQEAVLPPFFELKNVCFCWVKGAQGHHHCLKFFLQKSLRQCFTGWGGRVQTKIGLAYYAIYLPSLLREEQGHRPPVYSVCRETEAEGNYRDSQLRGKSQL